MFNADNGIFLIDDNSGSAIYLFPGDNQWHQDTMAFVDNISIPVQDLGGVTHNIAGLRYKSTSGTFFYFFSNNAVPNPQGAATFLVATSFDGNDWNGFPSNDPIERDSNLA